VPLYKRGDVWWFDFTIKGERYRGSTYQTSKTAAREYEGQERKRVAVEDAHGKIPTLEQAAAQWFSSRAEGRKSVKTIAQRVEIMLRHFGSETLITEIGTPHVETAIQARRVERTRQGKLPTNTTVNRDLIDTTLRPIMTYCDRVLELPVRRIAWTNVRLPEPKGRTRTFTDAEIEAWRNALPAWHRPVFDFMARYGVRLQEAFFHPDALNVELGEVQIRGKDRKNGVDLAIPLLEDDLRDLAARATRAREAELETVWYRQRKRGLTPIHWRGFQSASKAALAAAGIADARPAHDLRHHAATSVRRAGDVLVVQKLLGHEDLRSTARYAHPDREDVLKALKGAAGKKG
jgi:integrase